MEPSFTNKETPESESEAMMDVYRNGTRVTLKKENHSNKKLTWSVPAKATFFIVTGETLDGDILYLRHHLNEGHVYEKVNYAPTHGGFNEKPREPCDPTCKPNSNYPYTIPNGDLVTISNQFIKTVTVNLDKGGGGGGGVSDDLTWISLSYFIYGNFGDLPNIKRGGGVAEKKPSQWVYCVDAVPKKASEFVTFVPYLKWNVPNDVFADYPSEMNTTFVDAEYAPKSYNDRVIRQSYRELSTNSAPPRKMRTRDDEDDDESSSGESSDKYKVEKKFWILTPPEMGGAMPIQFGGVTRVPCRDKDTLVTQVNIRRVVVDRPQSGGSTKSSSGLDTQTLVTFPKRRLIVPESRHYLTRGDNLQDYDIFWYHDVARGSHAPASRFAARDDESVLLLGSLHEGALKVDKKVSWQREYDSSGGVVSVAYSFVTLIEGLGVKQKGDTNFVDMELWLRDDDVDEWLSKDVTYETRLDLLSEIKKDRVKVIKFQLGVKAGSKTDIFFKYRSRD